MDATRGVDARSAVECGCGRAWSADLFEQLPLVGVQFVPAGEDGPAEQLEMRNCCCRSTLARSIDLERACFLSWKKAGAALNEALRTRFDIPKAAEAERRAWGAWRRAVELPTQAGDAR